VLGAGGGVGLDVLRELELRQIAAKGSARTQRPGWIQADLTDADQTRKACEGASHVYLCAGLLYNRDVWRRDWPRIMDNVIAAAEAAQSRVIFIDNIYMYGPAPLQVPITEEHAQEPPSVKGAIRKQVANNLLAAHRAGRVRAVIARAPDFYGPGATNSVIGQMMIPKMLAGGKPVWLGDPNLNHSFGHIGDIARAMVVLALDDDSYGQVWHTPTSRERISATRIHEILSAETGYKGSMFAIPRWSIPILKWFVPVLGEVDEMAYQYFSDYTFSSAKFEARYPDFAITPYEQGLREMVAAYRKPTS
ncbi:MAG: NAD-dependent epimerase/dehydratase family protein, partial [Acidobacteriota bacterium]